MTRVLLPAVCLAAAVLAYPSAQSDLDALMSKVLDHRDQNWKKLQQYTLTERETLQITALVVFRLFGFEREYHWFPREGFFIRSPLKADGVAIDEERRRREEAAFLKNAQNAEKRRIEGESKKASAGSRAEGDVPIPGDIVLTGAVEDVISQTFEPGFIQSSQFMRFKFDQGQYALVGREKMLNREVLKIEYYPTRLFDDDTDRPCEPKQTNDDCENERKAEAGIQRQMNKVSLVTLWVDPAEQQILRYEFRFHELDFLPGRSIIRVESWRANMQMGEPFTNVWLPDAISMRGRVGSAAGPLEVRYDVKYRDYRIPETSGRIR